MSNAIRYDALLVRQLAAELNAGYGGRTVHGIELQPDSQRVIIDLEDSRLQWNLHPTSGHVGRTAAVLPLEQPVQLPRKARWSRTRAVFDDRVLMIELAGGARAHATMQIVFELLTNQWNAITLDADGKVLRQLKARTGGGRDLRRGQVYQLPQTQHDRSTSSLAEWLVYFQRLDPSAWKQTLLDKFAYSSPLNADAILAAADLTKAYERYQELLRRNAPHIIELNDARQPYPHSLWSAKSEPRESLLAAFEELGDFQLTEDVAAEIARRLYGIDRKIDRLREELTGAEAGVAAARKSADLLMTYATTITRGVRRVTLPDFEGGSLDIELDPALSPIENARELYEDARKRQRATQRIPKLIREAELSKQQLHDLNARAQSGALSASDVRALVRRPARQKEGGGPIEKLPYRRYRTSGGLEVRVGRSSRANDELTLHHTSPRDIWLHARDAAGAHVVLRWNEVEANPPLRDLMEAAVLAALHSRSRTSRTVPVDWTRRKHVHKRRKSPPGQVFIERAKTIFVEPDAGLEESLRDFER